MHLTEIELRIMVLTVSDSPMEVACLTTDPMAGFIDPCLRYGHFFSAREVLA